MTVVIVKVAQSRSMFIVTIAIVMTVLAIVVVVGARCNLEVAVVSEQGFPHRCEKWRFSLDYKQYGEAVFSSPAMLVRLPGRKDADPTQRFSRRRRCLVCVSYMQQVHQDP